MSARSAVVQPLAVVRCRLPAGCSTLPFFLSTVDALKWFQSSGTNGPRECHPGSGQTGRPEFCMFILYC
ncbi:hypothetical protein Bphyt_5148 [Paraburkholderia phytofirmans PsJN]|uniref:Uncharacterized protein n=1 Tax=Paraburkholderia phytofirmans (strain DSM 17436 / LMG 22146 / PsJN) TaxID=398527 RepID=B2TCT5_PARPJ|nr:hypothetical protein Bphyt_5148 [Paraburkholderia phytofirmans PsJN]